MGFFSSILEPFTGKEAAKESTRAGIRSARAEEEARNQLIERTQPFVDVGVGAAGGLQQFIDDPSGYSFLENNPMFQAAVNNAGDRIGNANASRGKFNSGGTVDQLFQNYLATGDQFVNSGFNRQYQPTQFGGNMALGVGTNVGNSITAGQNALNAGNIGAANARSAGMSNLIGLGTTIYGATGGFGNLFGGGGSGAISNAVAPSDYGSLGIGLGGGG